MTDFFIAYLCLNAAALLLLTKHQRRYLLWWSIGRITGRRWS